MVAGTMFGWIIMEATMVVLLVVFQHKGCGAYKEAGRVVGKGRLALLVLLCHARAVSLFFFVGLIHPAAANSTHCHPHHRPPPTVV